MIHSVCLERLPDGAIPAYDLPPDRQVEAWFMNGAGAWATQWQANRIFVPLSIDLLKEELDRGLRSWIADLTNTIPPEESGLLVFILLNSCLVDGLGHLVTGGLAYLPDADLFGDLAVPLEGRNPAEVISRLCDLDYDDDPYIRRCLHGPEQERAARQEEWRARHEEEKRDKSLANERALRLLLGCLTPEQRHELEAHQRFHVLGQNGQTFRIKASDHQNVYRLEDDREVMRYCVVSQTGMPVYDLMLAQKFMLESNIELFLRLANKWDLTTQFHDRLGILENRPGITLRQALADRVTAEIDREILGRVFAEAV